MEESYSGAERRRTKRVRVSLSVIYRVNEPLTVRLLTADREIKATILDLSEQGMAIVSDYDIPKLSVVMMRFTLFKVDKEDVSFYGPVEIAGEVRYNQKDGDEYRLGIHFTKIDPEDKREIANFANTAIKLLDREHRQ
ncbi:MAG: PilZ domain-containing protein [Candidatus Omnitrophica bacterium]|nr:PilZ domain-containing protein [Candidatus Omnitrophota bacterium]